MTPVIEAGSNAANPTLDELQEAAYNAMYEAWNTAVAKFDYRGYAEARTEPDYLAAVAQYEQTVANLEAALGPDAHCNAVDRDLWSTYSDIYKDDHGFRPRFHVTRAEAKAYLAQPQTASPTTAETA